MSTTGSYEELDDGRPSVRFERVYEHAIERVWATITEPSELEHWFPDTIELELRAGGRAVWSHETLGSHVGEVLAFEPPHRLAFTWGQDELRFELEALGEQRTRLTLVDVLSAADEAARNGAGWEVCLANLDALLGAGERGGDWAPHYDDWVAAGAPAGAAIPGV